LINKKYLSIFVISLFLAAFIFLMSFVLAALDAPTDLIFEDNTTTNYDKEGIFTVNWSDVTNAEGYTIFIYTNDTLSSAVNDSDISGYSFSNAVEANYTFTIQAENTTSTDEYTNSTNISIQVDLTGPALTLPEYTNTTSKINTEDLILNITVVDAVSGVTGSFCFVNVGGGSNASIEVDSGWCNSSTIDLTGLDDGNQTVNVYANDTLGNMGSNTSYVVQVDSAGPALTLPEYTNATYRKNTENVTLNITVVDTVSGVTGSFCFVNVGGGANISIPVSSGWCNSTNVNLTSLSDGNQTINVYANDTVGNLALNNSFVVQVDTTNPVIILSLTAATVNSLTLAVSGIDGTCSSNRGTLSGSTITETSISCGRSYSYTLTCTDAAGNVGTTTTSFLTTGCGGGSSGGGSATTWDMTHVEDGSELSEIGTIQKQLSIKERVKLKVDSQTHYIGVLELTSTGAKINIQSDPQEAVLSIGDSRKFEVTGDNIYDVLVTLNSIANSKADITITSIFEEITEETITEEEVKEDTAVEETGIDKVVEEEETNLTWLWIVIAVVVVLTILFFIRNKTFKKK